MPTKDELVDAMQEVQRRERSRQSRRAIFVTLVVIPAGVVLAFALIIGVRLMLA